MEAKAGSSRPLQRACLATTYKNLNSIFYKQFPTTYRYLNSIYAGFEYVE